MEPAHIRFGGGAAETVLHPIVLCVLILAALLIFMLPKNRVIIPVILSIFLVPLSQVLVLGGLHWTVVRLVIVMGIIRWCASSHRSLAGGFTVIDAVFVCWALANALAFCLLYMESQAFINRAAFLVDALGGYFLLRYLIRNREDVVLLITLYAVVAAVMAVLMSNEQISHRNIYEYLGGIGSGTEMRSGKFRSQGVFQHSLLAGAFGGTCLPLFAGLMKDKRTRFIAVTGAVASTIMTITTYGSTPYMIYMAGVLGLLLWPCRDQMRMVRWGVALSLIALHLVMKAPVWALIARVDLTGSSSSYHRYLLVDSLFTHVGDWWLIGTKNYDTWGPDVWDLSNQFVAYAFRGGLATIGMFILLIVLSFKTVGEARRQTHDSNLRWFCWCAGAAVFAHMTAFFGVNYFDQTEVAWLGMLAIVVATQNSAVARNRASGAPVSRLVNCRISGAELPGMTYAHRVSNRAIRGSDGSETESECLDGNTRLFLG